MKIAFCFPGQGSLEVGMGKDIAEAVPEAMEVFERGSEAAGLDLRRLCFESPLSDIVATEVQQPALVAASLAVLAAIRARGIEPDYVVGHSVGEFAALAAAGTVELEDAVALVRERGIATAEAARERPGSMAAILGLDDEIVEDLCRRITEVWPANYNCPGQLVVSGVNAAVEECCAEAEREGAKRAIKLRVSGAFHSPLVARAAERLKPAVDRVRFSAPTAPFMSTVTAKIEDRLESARDEVRVTLRDERIGYTGLTESGRNVQVRVRDADTIGRAREVLSALTEPVASGVFGTGIVTELAMQGPEPGRFRSTLTEEGITYRINTAISQSIEVVSRRVNELGTTEPIIQRQGLVGAEHHPPRHRARDRGCFLPRQQKRGICRVKHLAAAVVPCDRPLIDIRRNDFHRDTGRLQDSAPHPAARRKHQRFGAEPQPPAQETTWRLRSAKSFITAAAVSSIERRVTSITGQPWRAQSFRAAAISPATAALST